MKLSEAIAYIQCEKTSRGYLVSFEVRDGGVLRSDHFPDVRAGEKPIETEEEAWDLAIRFAHARKQDVVNVYVVTWYGKARVGNFCPVQGYQGRLLNKYTGGEGPR